MLFPTATFAVFFMIVLPVSWALHAAPARMDGLDPARELRVLRLVGLAVRLPARGLDGGEPRLAVGIFRSATAAARKALARPGRRLQSVPPRLLQVLRLLPQHRLRLLRPARLRPSHRVNVALPVGISFFTFTITYVVDVYRGELVPASFSLRALRLVLPAPRRRPHRPPATLPQLETRATLVARRHERALPDRHRPVKKVVIANQLASNIVDGVFEARPASRRSRCSARLRLRRPDLLRFLRLHRHRDRARAAARVRSRRTSTRRTRRPLGLLAPLAHLALALAPRLPLHPPRRQPRAGSGRTAT